MGIKKIKYKRKRKSNLNKFYIIIIIALLSIGVGYSLINTNLTINGNVELRLEETINLLQPGTVDVNGMTITIDGEGYITLDGTLSSATTNKFVKISNGLDVKAGSTATIFPTWFNGAEPFGQAGYIATHKVEIISGSILTTASDYFNVGLRNDNNLAELNLKLTDNLYELTGILSGDVLVQYFYLRAGLRCDNFKIKVTLVERAPDPVTPPVITGTTMHERMSANSLSIAGITTTVNADKSVSLAGTATARSFIRLTDGIARVTTFPATWPTNAIAFAVSGQHVRFKVKVLSGTMSGTQINCCLRYKTSNTAAAVIKLIDDLDSNNEASITFTLTEDISVLYFFMTEDAVCNNVQLEITLQEV